MALSATVAGELRTTGNDLNGCGYNTAAAGGVDYSQQDAAQVFIDGATITGVVQATTTDILIVGYTVATTDVGNLLQVTGGTATAGFYEIISVNTGTNTWRMDRSVGTAAQTVVGRMGGGLLTVGKAGSVPWVAGNYLYVKYHASNVYSVTSTSSNVVNGRLSISVGSISLPFSLIGYETTHGDNTGNRPIIRWGTNAANNTLVAFSAQHIMRNLILDGDRANRTLTKCFSASGSGIIDTCKFMGSNAGATTFTTGTHYLTNCEFVDHTVAASIAVTTAGQEFQVIDCTFHDLAFDALTLNQTARLMVESCLFDTITGKGIVCSNTGTADGPNVTDCVFYNISSDAINLAGSCMAYIRGCLFELIGGWGINTTLAGAQFSTIMKRCGFYTNSITSGKYDTAKMLTMNITSEVTVGSAGSFFVDAPNQDFTVNNTTGQGALVRGIGYIPPGMPSTSYRDYGTYQHQDSGGGSAAGPLVGPGRLIRS